MEVDMGAVHHPLLHFQNRPELRYKVEEQHCPQRNQKQFAAQHHAWQHGLYYCDDDDDV